MFSVFSYTQTFSLLQMPAGEAGLCKAAPQLIAQQPDWVGKRPSAGFTVPVGRTRLSFSLAKDFVPPSPSHRDTGDRQPVLTGYKPGSHSKLHSDTCCEIEQHQDYTLWGKFSSFIHLNVSGFGGSFPRCAVAAVVLCVSVGSGRMAREERMHPELRYCWVQVLAVGWEQVFMALGTVI